MKRKITPTARISARVSLSGSKYLANRLVVIAALANETMTLNQVVANDDINTAIIGLRQLGYRISREGDCVVAEPRVSACITSAHVDTSHSGTFSRFITAVASIQSFPVTIKGSPKMNTRPMGELYDALSQLGVELSAHNQCLPITVTGPWQGVTCKVDGSKSSQYVSGLLLAAGASGQTLDIELCGEQVSTQYVDMTAALMKQFGVSVDKVGSTLYRVNGTGYRGGDIVIPPDPVSSSYFMAAAAIVGGEITLESFDHQSLQGESAFYQVLEAMGCEVIIGDKGELSLVAKNGLTAVDRDMGEMPDVVQTMAVVAAFAKGTTMMRNIAHLAYKESNRIVDTATELQKLGVQVSYGEDYLAVTGDPSGRHYCGTLIDTYDDHRMAMSMALMGLKIDNVVINEASVVSKSFPDYWDKLLEVGVVSKQV